MSHIEDFSNRLADLDWTWWPLLSLRPAKDQPISPRIVGRTTLFFGPAAALLTGAFSWFEGERHVRVLLSLGLLTVLIFYLIMSGVTARYWNRRAVRLRRKRQATWRLPPNDALQPTSDQQHCG